MHILFLSHYFPPEVNAPASRTFDHCREWCRRGHRVTVVTCAPNHPSGTVYSGHRNRMWHRSETYGIEVIRLWTYLAPNEGIVRRILSYASFLVAAALAAPFLPRPDVVVSTSPQLFCGLSGYVVSRAKRVPWVLEIRDLWPEAIRAVDAIRNRMVIRSLEVIEAWSYRKADRVITVTRAFCAHIEARGAEPGSVAVITNGVNLDLFGEPRRDPELRRDLGLSGRFVVGYFGTLGMAHRLETLMEAARLLRDEPSIAFLIVGDGAERAKLERLRDAYGLDSVIMLGQQPKERMPGLWGVCDAGLAHMRRSHLFTTMIPSKMFEALAMERPILLGFEGESREIVEEAGCGLGFEPENPQALANAVRRLAADPELAREMGRRGRDLVHERYDRRKLALTFADLLHPVVRQAGPPAPVSLEQSARQNR
jgi:glycosyltransferase involved in cell wall biosynthesis